MPIAAAARSRWKKRLSFGGGGGHHHHRNPSSSISNSAPSSPSPSPSESPTPMSLTCPISSSLMFDPVITPTGHTFERACIEACRELNFVPPTLSLSSLDFSSASFLLIPNAALRAAIIDWCDRSALPHPPPLSHDSARALVQNLILTTPNPNPNPNSNKIKQQQQQNPSSSNSSNSSSCCSYPSSSSTSSFSSSDIHPTAAPTSSSPSSLLVDVDPETPKSTATADPATTTTTSTTTTTVLLVEDSEAEAEAEAILVKLKNPQISIKESGLVTLRLSARESSQRRISLCTPSLLSALVPMVLSANPSIQINATAALVNLSIDPANKVKIVRSGAVPHLVEALRPADNRSDETRYNAAGALFSLALEDENKLAIGVLGAIPPLVNLFCHCQQQQQQSEFAGAGHGVARVEAGMALYHLSLAQNNLSKIAKTAGAVKSILNTATANAAVAVGIEVEQAEETMRLRLRLRRVAMMLLASLARRNEGRVALMDADAVRAMVGMMKDGAAGSKEEYCLAVMYEMSKGSLRFRALARAAGAERVLLAMAGDDNMEGRGEVGKEMATRTLKVVRGDPEKGVMLMLGDEYYDEEGGVGTVVSDGLVSLRRRCDDFGGGSGANSANF